MENCRFKHCRRRTRSGNYHQFSIDMGWRPGTLERLWHRYSGSTFTTTDFLNIDLDRFSSKDEVERYKQRLYLLRKAGWLTAKTLKAGKKRWSLFQFSNKSRKYKNDWFNFDNERGPLVKFNKFLNPPQPKIIREEVEKEIKFSERDRFVGST